jgi:hypothetical protein
MCKRNTMTKIQKQVRKDVTHKEGRTWEKIKKELLEERWRQTEAWLLCNLQIVESMGGGNKISNFWAVPYLIMY